MSSPVLPGTFNARDLGGLETVDGDVVRSGVIIRSDAPVALGETGHAALRRLGLTTAIDLREPVEVDLDPPDLEALGIVPDSVPILGPEFDLGENHTLDEIYRLMLATRGERFAAAITVLSRADGPALVFCSAGKDRTGILSALVLAAVGVREDEIVADYHQTELNMQGPFRDAIVARAVKAGIADQEIATKVGAPLELMTETLRWLRQEHGGAAAYLRHHGVSDPQLGALRDRLITPAASAARCA